MILVDYGALKNDLKLTFIAETSESFAVWPAWAWPSRASALRRSSLVVWKVSDVPDMLVDMMVVLRVRVLGCNVLVVD